MSRDLAAVKNTNTALFYGKIMILFICSEVAVIRHDGECDISAGNSMLIIQSNSRSISSRDKTVIFS